MRPDEAEKAQNGWFPSLRNAASVAVDHVGLVGGRRRKGCGARDIHSIPRPVQGSTSGQLIRIRSVAYFTGAMTGWVVNGAAGKRPVRWRDACALT
jgi:hypothetical protein